MKKCYTVCVFATMYENIYKYMQYIWKYTCMLSGMAQIIRKQARYSMEIMCRDSKPKQWEDDRNLVVRQDSVLQKSSGAEFFFSS